jgi:hypothetical protein
MTTEPEPIEEDDETLDGVRKAYNRADKRANEAATRADAAERELAFFRAGLTAEDLSSPVGALFVDAYKGELDAEAVKNAWEAVSGTASAAEEPPPPADDAAQQMERQRLQTGSLGDTGEAPPEPLRGEDGSAAKAARAAIAGGAGRDESVGVMFRELVAGAVQGDQSVIVPFGGLTE